jgi:hypothetical protein
MLIMFRWMLPLVLLLTTIVPLVFGIYLVVKGIWAYKEGDRSRFTKLLFSGLVLIFVVPTLLAMLIGFLALMVFNG